MAGLFSPFAAWAGDYLGSDEPDYDQMPDMADQQPIDPLVVGHGADLIPLHQPVPALTRRPYEDEMISPDYMDIGSRPDENYLRYLAMLSRNRWEGF